MCKIIVAMVLLSACRLAEEPLQQAKGFASGDVVFDAENISKTAVAQCEDDSCRTKTPLSAKLHQVALSDQQIEGALQFNNLHISFEAGDKIYTCTRLSTPMGKMTLLQRGNDDKYCYAQAKGKDYVRQFALACLKEQDWQLVAGFEAEALQKFTCEKDDTKISSACFFDAEECSDANWPASIKSIYVAKSAEPTTARANETKITADTKLKDVTIKAEWRFAGDVTCEGIGKTITFESTTIIKTKDLTFTNTDQNVEDLTIDFSCQHNNSALPVTPFTDKGICVLKDKKNFPENIDDCDKDGVDYIKITFAPKGN